MTLKEIIRICYTVFVLPVSDISRTLDYCLLLPGSHQDQGKVHLHIYYALVTIGNAWHALVKLGYDMHWLLARPR